MVLSVLSMVDMLVVFVSLRIVRFLFVCGRTAVVFLFVSNDGRKRFPGRNCGLSLEKRSNPSLA